jgi:hypothetical protein
MITKMKNNVNTVKNKVNIDDFLTLIYWVHTYCVLMNKKFNHNNLLEQAQTYKLTNTPFDIQIHRIDELMIDACQIYFKIKETEGKIMETYDSLNIAFISKDMLLNETHNYERIFEDLIENYRYEDPEVRGIQKGFLLEKMNKYVAEEKYENAAVIRDLLKEF